MKKVDEVEFLLKCAKIEADHYTAAGYEPLVVTPRNGWLSTMLVTGMHEHNVKAFTYLGHGSPGTLTGPPDSPSAERFATQILAYYSQHPNTCRTQLNKMRLISCFSGLTSTCEEGTGEGYPWTVGTKMGFRSLWDYVKDKKPKDFWTTRIGVSPLIMMLTVLGGL